MFWEQPWFPLRADAVAQPGLKHSPEGMGSGCCSPVMGIPPPRHSRLEHGVAAVTAEPGLELCSQTLPLQPRGDCGVLEVEAFLLSLFHVERLMLSTGEELG